MRVEQSRLREGRRLGKLTAVDPRRPYGAYVIVRAPATPAIVIVMPCV